QRPETADALLAELEAASYAVTSGGGTPAGAVLGGDTPPGAAVPAQAGMTAPLGTMPLGTMPLGTPAAAVTTPLAAPNAVDPTVGVRAPHPATRRRPTAVLGGALLGMAIVLLGACALVR